jgi:ferritin-like metal-binding protein YciE
MALEQHLVVHLQHMFVNERDYQMYLCDWAGRVKDQQLKAAVNTEIQGINQEMDNLKRCLDELGAPLNDDMTSPLVKALRLDDDATMDAMPDATPLDMDTHLAMTDISFGSAEIGTYQSMLTLAKMGKHAGVAHILEETLQHEEEDLQKMQSLLCSLSSLGGGEQRAA